MSDMCPDLERKVGSYFSREASVNKIPVRMIKELGKDQMNSASNCEDKNFGMQVGTNELTNGACRNLDMDVNIPPGDINLDHEEKWDPALTESSSSFDGNGTSFSKPDPELFDDALSALPLDGYSDLFQTKRKKQTSKWRKHIGPLMWRCKWVELQIKKFESQAQKYDKEVAEYQQLDNCTSKNVNGEVVMKRKKRRRAEDTEDIASYMSHHNLFSYFENKNSATTDAACTNGRWANQGLGVDKTSNGTKQIEYDEELQSNEFIDGDTLEQLFWKIGLMQWQISEMKTRAHKVLSENASRICSTENLDLLEPCNNSLTSSAENPLSPVSHEDNDTKMVDVPMPENAALRLGEVGHVMGNMKSTNPPAIEGSSNLSGPILMYNRRTKKNADKLKEVSTVSTQEPQMPKEEHFPSFEAPESSPLKLRSMSKLMATNTIGTTSNKRKRAMRKPSFGKWNR